MDEQTGSDGAAALGAAAADETRTADGGGQFDRAAAILGMATGDEPGPRMPAVRLTPDNLLPVARLIGQVMHRIDLFEQNGVLWYFDFRGERKEMTPLAFRTWISNHVLLWEKRDKTSDDPIPVTMAKEHAATVLESDDFLRGVRPLNGVNRVRLPVLRRNGKVEMLPWGYDGETGIYTVPGGLQYADDMSIESARGVFRRRFGTFPLTDPRSMAVQVAACLALYVRHLPGGTGLRPGFLWLANKPESGKSVLAKAAQYAVLGRCPAVKMKKGEQLDKEMEAFAIAGVPCLFLDNVRGGIDSPTLEQMMTSEESEGRGMGGHGLFSAKNAALLFATGNGIKLTADAERRFLVIDLFEKGDPMERVKDEILNDDLMKSPEWRAEMLAAMWAMVRTWHEAGMPRGSVLRGSFETWCALIGGIVEAAGYENPCQRAEIPDAINPEAMEFKELLGLIVCEMGERRERDFTLEDLARLGRSAQLFERIIGTAAEGKALAAKTDKLARDEMMMAADRGMMTQEQRQKFGYLIGKEAGGEPKWKGRPVEFGKRHQARKSTYTIRLSWDPTAKV